MKISNIYELLDNKDLVPEVRSFVDNEADSLMLLELYNRLSIKNVEKVHSFSLDKNDYAKQGDIFILNFLRKSPKGQTVGIIQGKGELLYEALQDGIGNIIEMH